MKNKIFENGLYIVLVILFILLSLVFVKEYVSNEKRKYEEHNDFTRGDIVMTLSYHKDQTLQYHAIRHVQLYTDEEKTSKGDLVYDFASYEFVPILNYLNRTSENNQLIDSFSGIMEFLLDFNSATIGVAEDVFIKQPSGKYYIYKNGTYTYETKKEVISKNAFKKMYQEYLETINFENVEENFINGLIENKDISTKYTYNEIKKNVLSNYDKFYAANEDVIISIISKDLERFVKFLYTDYLFIDRDNNDKRYLLKDVDTELLEVSFKFKEGDRIYYASSKYYTHNYVLDIYDVWEQLREKGYPMLYS